MHEMAIAQGILDIALNAAQGQGAIKRIKLKIGEMAGVVPESLHFCFESVAAQTAATGAELEIELVPLKAVCGSCKNEFAVQEYRFVCPECRAITVDIVSGRELAVEHLEVE